MWERSLGDGSRNMKSLEGAETRHGAGFFFPRESRFTLYGWPSSGVEEGRSDLRRVDPGTLRVGSRPEYRSFPDLLGEGVGGRGLPPDTGHTSGHLVPSSVPRWGRFPTPTWNLSVPPRQGVGHYWERLVPPRSPSRLTPTRGRPVVPDSRSSGTRWDKDAP